MEKIVSLLNENTIDLNVNVDSKGEVIEHLIDIMNDNRILVEQDKGITMELMHGIAVFQLHDHCQSALAALTVKKGLVIDGKLIKIFFMVSRQGPLEKLADFLNDNDFDMDLVEDKLIKLKSQEANNEFVIFTKINNGIKQTIPFIIGSGMLISMAILIVQYHLFGINKISSNILIADIYILGDAINNLIVILLAGFIGYQIAQKDGFVAGISCGVASQLDVIYLNAKHDPGFLGGIAAGLIGGYMALLVKKICKKIPEKLEVLKTMIIYPGVLIGAAGLIMYYFSYDLGIINVSFSQQVSELEEFAKPILGLVLGALLVIKPGGSLSKLVYIFAIWQILEDNFTIMAAVMASSMASILAISLATTIFKNKFTSEEIKMGKSNYLKGFCLDFTGISYFYQKDMHLVKKALIIAAMIAGGLSMIYNCGIRLPHGGIFALPFMLHPLKYLVAVFSGSICGCFVYGFLKETGEK